MRIGMKRLMVFVLPLAALLVTSACNPTAPPSAATKAASTAPTAAPKADATKPSASATAGPTIAASKPTGTPIKIGYLTPLTGRAAQSGLLQRVANNMAEEDINKAKISSRKASPMIPSGRKHWASPRNWSDKA